MSSKYFVELSVLFHHIYNRNYSICSHIIATTLFKHGEIKYDWCFLETSNIDDIIPVYWVPSISSWLWGMMKYEIICGLMGIFVILDLGSLYFVDGGYP